MVNDNSNLENQLDLPQTISIGQSIAKARKSAGFTQLDLCQKIDISYSTLTKLERGAIKSPSVFTLDQIAKATRTTIDGLLKGELKPAPATTLNWHNSATSKSGVRFVYFNLNGLMVGYQNLLARLGQISDQDLATVNRFFYHHYSAVWTGQLTLVELEDIARDELKLPAIDWLDLLTTELKLSRALKTTLKWIARHYLIGLIVGGPEQLVPRLQQAGKLPELDFQTVINSDRINHQLFSEPFYQLAVNRVQPALANQILLVDSSLVNLFGANQAGWQGLLIGHHEPKVAAGHLRSVLEF